MDYDYSETLKKYDIEERDSALLSAITDADVELLLAINTYYLRKDRFCVGTIDECVRNGTFFKIIERMRELETR